MFWHIDIQLAVDDMTKLFEKIEDAVESEIGKRYAEYEEYQNTPIEPEIPFDVAFGKLEWLGSEFFTAASDYRLWAYGGFLTTALAWLNDRLLLITDIQSHSTNAVLSQKWWGVAVDHKREPSLSQILAKWLDDTNMYERMNLWITARNRFVHSLGVVSSADERKRLADGLGLSFDTYSHMQLMPEHCRLLLRDIKVAGVAISMKVKIE